MSRLLQIKILTNLQDRISAPLRKIQGLTGSSAQSLKKLQERLKGLEATQKTVGRFRELSSSLKLTRTGMRDAQTRVSELATRMRQATEPTAALTRVFKQAVRVSQRLKTTHGEQLIKLNDLRKTMHTAGLSTRSLSQGERGLHDQIAKTNQALSQQKLQLSRVAEQQKKLGAIKTRMQSQRQIASSAAAKGTAGLAAGGGAMYAAARLLLPGLHFNSEMSKVQALARLEDKSQALVDLRSQAKHLGATTSFTALDAAQGQSYLAMAGFDPNKIMSAMPGILNLAKTAGVDVGTTADIGSNVLDSFGLTADQMGRVGDILVDSFTRSSTDLRLLGETMKYVGPVAFGLKQDLETIAGMASRLASKGIKGSDAGTALRSVISLLAAPSPKAAKSMENLGIVVRDLKGNMRPLPEILKDMANATKKYGNIDSAVFIKEITDKSTLTAMMSLIEESRSGALDQIIEEMRHTQGETDRAALVMSNNLSGDIDKVKSVWEALNLEIFEQQNSALRELATNLNRIIGRLNDWSKANPELSKTIVRNIGYVLALVAGVGALALTLGAILGPFAMLGYVLSWVGISFKGILLAMSRFMLLNPIGLLITAVAVGAYFIIKQWQSITTVIKESWAGCQAYVIDTWDSIVDTYGEQFKKIADFLLAPFNLIYAFFDKLFRYFGIDLKAEMTRYGSLMIDWMIDGIKSQAQAIKQAIKGLLVDAGNWIKDKLGIDRGQAFDFKVKLNPMMSRPALGNLSAALSPLSVKPLPPINFATLPPIKAPAIQAAERAKQTAMRGASHQNVSININPAPGMNATDIGRAVAKELDKQKREQLARARSAFVYAND